MSEYNKPFFESEEARERHIAELEAERCERIGKFSAQSTVFLLPENYNLDIYLDDGWSNYVEIPRVLKISNSFSQAENAAAKLKLEPEHTPKSKADQLVIDGRSSIPFAMHTAFYSNEIDALMGNPRFCADQSTPYRDGYHMAYTQDYAIPNSQLLESLDQTNPHDIEAFKDLIDAYVETQLLLCSYGMFDRTFKFTDNFGVFPDFDVPWSANERIRLLDLGELILSLTAVIDVVSKKEWEQIVTKAEYTQLPQALQEHFNTQCEKYLTVENVIARWGRAGAPHSSISTTRAIDAKIPLRLPRVLWEKSA